jgi:DNA-binding transcriptional MerR regulator
MTTRINGQIYYRTSEACRMVGISRNTLYRMVRLTVFNEAERRDHRGWRLFTREDIIQLKAQVNRIEFTKPSGTSTGLHRT